MPPYPQNLVILGIIIAACSVAVFAVRSSEHDENVARLEIDARIDARLTPVTAMGD